MDQKMHILKARKQITKDIRTYVRSQKEEWRRVPWLALQADGRGGYSEHYQYAYSYGLWFVHRMGTRPVIDCATGELTTPYESSPLSDDEVFELGNHLDDLTATLVTRRLHLAASNKIPSWSNQEEFDARAKWRTELAERYKLERLYSREKKARAA
jgi:hypothetical protein